MFIVFEGKDGVGKTTQCKLLCEKLNNSVYMCFPNYSTKVGEKIKEYIQSYTNTDTNNDTNKDVNTDIYTDTNIDTNTDTNKDVNTDTNMHIDPIILNSLFITNFIECQHIIEEYKKKYNYIICDWYIFSNIAYSMQNKIEYEYLNSLVSKLIKPDLIIYLYSNTNAYKELDWFEKQYEHIDENYNYVLNKYKYIKCINICIDKYPSDKEKSINIIHNHIYAKIKFNPYNHIYLLHCVNDYK